MNASAIYDPVGHRMVVFGGLSPSGSKNDLWSFHLSSHTWTDITPAAGPAPPQRFTPSSVYDPAGHRMLMWSGQGTGFFNDMWSFDLTSHTWTELLPPDPKPNIRYGTASIFDTVAQDLVTFAGFTNQGRFDDTWRFNPDSVSWSNVSPTSGNPLERCLHTACYDAFGHRMILYGGQNAGALGDVWAFDLTSDTWMELTPPVGPAGRWFAVSVYNDQTNHVVVFGGNLGGSKTNEVLTFNLSTNSWQSAATAGVPPEARDGSAGVYVPTEDRMIIFGGQVNGLQSDVWSLDHLSSIVSVDSDDPHVPRRFRLFQNAPNPFNPLTRIRYSLASEARVTLEIFNIIGQRVRTLVSGANLGADVYEAFWDGKDEQARPVGSGAYTCRITAGDLFDTKTMILLK
jgi:hypothetical protein